MRKIYRLIKREYLAAVKTKGFIVMLIVAPVMMGGSGLAMALLKDNVDIADKRLIVMDHTGMLVDSLIQAAEKRNASEVYDQESGEKVRPAYLVESVSGISESKLAAARLAWSDSIRNGTIYAFMEIGPAVIQPSRDPAGAYINFHAENSTIDDLRRWSGWPLNDNLRKLRLDEAGISIAAAPDLFNWVNVDGLGLVSVDDTGEIQEAERSNEIEAILVPAIMAMLMFLMMMMGAMPQLNSVMEEKTQRIAEVILGSVTPFQFMMGKVLGGLAVALTGSLVYVIGGAIYIQRMGWERYLPYETLPWFFVFMILNIFMLGSLLAALGSICNDARDAQNLTFPAILPAMLPMFIFVPVIEHPMSTFAQWASLIPPFTPMLMTVRLATPQSIPAWHPWAGLAGVLALTLFIVWAGGRLFRSGILMQGATLSFKNIAKWTLRG